MLRKLFKKNRKLTAALTLGVCLAAASPSAFALNYNGTATYGGNKPVSFSGYQYVDADTVNIFFDKDIVSPGEVEMDMFTIKLHNYPYTTVNVSSITKYAGTGYSGTSDTGLPKGTEVVMNLGSNLAPNTLYDVTINSLLMDTNGITLGNYMDREDFKFTFKTPTVDLEGNPCYTGDPYVTYVVGDGNTTGVSYESNMTVIFDRPLAASALSSFKSTLDANFDNTSHSNAQVPGTESYGVVSNDNSGNTTFFFPMTKQSKTSTVYNRASDGSHSYSLSLPGTFTDTYGTATTSYSGGGSSYSFSTDSADYPGWEMNGVDGLAANGPITVTAGDDSLTVQWYGSPITPAPTGYKFYATTGGQYTGSYTLVGTYANSVSVGTLASYTISGLANNTEYWVRVVPYNSAGSVGFSKTSTAKVRTL